jgi:hypothetical protein
MIASSAIIMLRHTFLCSNSLSRFISDGIKLEDYFFRLSPADPGHAAQLNRRHAHVLLLQYAKSSGSLENQAFQENSPLFNRSFPASFIEDKANLQTGTSQKECKRSGLHTSQKRNYLIYDSLFIIVK